MNTVLHERKKLTEALTESLNQKAFLTKTIQVINSDWKELDNHLQHARWPQAKHQAHQLRGIFYLLEAGELLNSLQNIEDVNLPLISEATFRQQLEQQISSFCMQIKQHISD